MRVALDDHGLELGHFLLSLGVRHIGRGRGDCNDFGNGLLAVAGISSSNAKHSSALLRGVVLAVASILSDSLRLDGLGLLLPDLVLLIRVVGIHLILKHHLLDRVSVGSWPFVVAEDHALGLVLSQDDFVDHLVLAV